MALLLAGCSTSNLPWNKQPESDEVNLAFRLERNLVQLQTLEINGLAGRYIFGSATRKSVIDPRLASRLGAPGRGYKLQVAEKDTLRLTPIVADLGDSIDAIVGADLIGNKAVTVDYRLGMVTYQKYGIAPGLMTIYRFSGAPEITVMLDGSPIGAIVDTTSPDTLVLPGEPARQMANVSVAGVDFGSIDVKRAPVERPRIGNRLLSHFLVSIDYGKGAVGLYADPRVPRPPLPPLTPPASR